MQRFPPKIQRALLACCLLLGAARSEAQSPVRNVLLLQSFNRGNMALDDFTGIFRIELDKVTGTSVKVSQIVIDPTGFVGAPEQAVVDYIEAMLANRRRPDLIVTIAAPAALFTRRHRQQLFPETPLMLTAVDERFLRDAPLGENEAAVPVVNDVPRRIEEVLQLLPQTRHVFMVLGAGEIGQAWRDGLTEEFKRFDGRLTFSWSNGLTLPEMLSRSASLPPDSAIFYLTFGTDAQGWASADQRVLAELRAVANAPLFGLHSVMLGTGIVGGALMSIEDLGHNAARAASRILSSGSARGVTIPPQSPGPPTFDWRELQRWGIPESRLPTGSIVRYRGPSLWQEHKFTVLGAVAALAIQALLILGLLYQRRARQQAELESRRNLALAADAGRRQTMSTLTSSIAHELGQPLSSMIYNTQALEMLIAGGHATPDAIREILSDIKSQGVQATQIIDRVRTMLRGRDVEKKPTDLHAVITESLALVAHDINARQISAAIHLSSRSCVIAGDQVLLQQVIVNLLLNAMDAMAAVPPERRYLTVRSDVSPADITVSVSDTGTGLPVDVSTLFTPFVTQKSHGLGIGLTIVRSIVDAHGGTIGAQNNRDGGATFTIKFRRSDTAISMSAPFVAERRSAAHRRH